MIDIIGKLLKIEKQVTQLVCNKIKCSHAFLTSIYEYDPDNPLEGWKAPKNPTLGDTISVLFYNNIIVSYTYIVGEGNINSIMPSPYTPPFLSYTAEVSRTPATPNIRATQVVIDNTTGVTVTVSLEKIYGVDYIILNGLELIQDKRYVLGIQIDDLTVSFMEENTEYRVNLELTGDGQKYGIYLQKRVFNTQAWVNVDENTPFTTTYDVRIYT